MKIAITGAAGNLGSLLATSLLGSEHHLNLLIHHKDVSGPLKTSSQTSVFKVDLDQKSTLPDALQGVDVIVHFAGILFKGNPEKFLPVTNTVYFHHLLDVAVEQEVKRIILISFPHVEGESFPDCPATGHLEAEPESMHAATRLEEEKLLFRYGEKYGFEGVSLRLGMVYGKNILMIDAAQWFAKYCLLGVWKTPTYIHLISKADFIKATIAAIEKEEIEGIYHIGDEGVQTLQEFLDDITSHAGHKKPWRMPVWMIMTAARIFETTSVLFNVKSPLTIDFVKIGMVSYYGDTTRMRKELLPELTYKTYKEGIDT